MAKIFANSGDPDQTPRSAASDLGLHCLPITLLGAPDYNELNGKILLLAFNTPRKPASENVVCLCRLLNILANFSDILFACMQTVWTQIRLLKEQSDLDPHCLQQ